MPRHTKPAHPTWLKAVCAVFLASPFALAAGWTIGAWLEPSPAPINEAGQLLAPTPARSIPPSGALSCPPTANP